MKKKYALENTLRHWRKERGYTQAKLAKATGVSRQTIILIESGRLNPSVRLALALAKEIDVPLTTLFSLAEKPVIKEPEQTEPPASQEPRPKPAFLYTPNPAPADNDEEPHNPSIWSFDNLS